MKSLIGTSWPAPAKLNLMLHVVGQRPDGYHLLQTVFQLLDFGDTLRFMPRDDGKIVHTNPLPGVPAESDLTVRAAHLLQQTGNCSQGIEIQIDKHLPMGGGLGGGSSNAATTLVALNQLWRTGLDDASLAKLGLQLGADVPVFIKGRTAWAEGIGEKLTPLELEQPWFLVLIPQCHVATVEVFTAPDLTRNTPRITIRDFLVGRGHNDCLPVVRRQHPEVATALEWLNQFAEARLTGTGACVYAAFERETDALEVLQQLPTGLEGFVARGVNRSPLLDVVKPDR